MDKKLLEAITKEVCSYLNVDENLLFCQSHELRVQEAKRYICYFAIFQGVASTRIAKYFGYIGDDCRHVERHSEKVKDHMRQHVNSQLQRDIEKLAGIIENCYVGIYA